MKTSSDRSFFFMLACAVALLLALAPLAMSASNLEEKARYEKVLEEKVDALLESMLGPGKARVMVQATIDFTTRENVVTGVEEGAPLPEPVLPPGEKPWWAGIMENVRQSAETIPGSTTVKKETIYPQAMVKQLVVTLALSDSLSSQQVDKVRAVVSGMLEMDTARGDRIMVVRASFAPIWYTPEMMSLLIRYGVISAVLIAAMAILGFGFIKMASAMSSVAGGGSQKISMEMGGFGGGGEAPAGAESGLLAGGLKPAHAGGGAPGEPAAPGGPVVFNVAPDKLSTLVGMLTKDSPEDIALIAVHLPPEQRSKFISMFPPQTAAEILASVANVRFIEPEIVAQIKEEIERRLSASVGGYEKALEFLDTMSQAEKKRLYETMVKTHPDTAEQVRRTLIFPEDLLKLNDKDFGLVISGVPMAQIALAAWALPQAVKDKFKSHVTKNSWQMIEQAQKFDRPAEAEIEKAVDMLVNAMAKLADAGRLASFKRARPEIAFEAEAKPAEAAPPPPPPDMTTRVKVPSARDIT